MVLAIMSRPLRAQNPGAPAAYWAYIGTYTGPKSQGIYLIKLDAATAALTSARLVAKATNPNFLAIHPQLRTLYAVCDGDSRAKETEVAAFAITQENGDLREIGRTTAGGKQGCYVSITPDGHTALVANYAGSVSALPLAADGTFKPVPATVVQHHGNSINLLRQEGPHAHCFDADPAGLFALAADLGLDKILVYRLNSAGDPVQPGDGPGFSLTPGSGPRHIAFDPLGRFVYIVSEMASTVTACRYDAAHGTLAALQTISTLPPDFRGSNTGAEIHIHPSGRFLYASNRGHDSIACFSINGDTGKLSSIGYTPTRGKMPRGFGIDPSGRFLLAANKESDSVAAFRIDPQQGTLAAAGPEVTIPSPVCVVITPVTQ